MNKWIGFAFSASLVASAVIAGCGGDTNSVTTLFQDAGTPDATMVTIFDAALPDAGCTNGAVCNGVCVATASSPTNCGGCGNTCPTGQVCSMGACTSTCAGALTTCGAACVDTTSDGANCGGCGNTCGSDMVCSAGNCVTSCGGGTTACGSSCVDEKADPNNCGACGTTCSAGQVCSLGKCATTCATGLTECAISGGAAVDGGTGASDAGAADGGDTTMGGGTAVNLCTDATSDPNNCGGCGVKCAAGQLCSNGQCAVSCLAGLVQCGSRCVDPTSNGNFCGATAGCGADAGSSGTVCAAGQVCTGGPDGTGICATTCAANEVNCGGTCIDPTTNRTACGAKGDCSNVNAVGSTTNSAGATCGAGTVCVAATGANAPGQCAVSCLPGEVNCNGTCVDPKTNSGACGAAGNCTNDGAMTGGVTDSKGANCLDAAHGGGGEVCSNGACVANCAQGQVNCGGTCVDPQTNGNFCGAQGDCVTHLPAIAGDSAGAKCTAGTLCSAGTCATTCQTGQINCAGTCVDPNTNSNACGAKGNCTNVNTGGATTNSSGATCATGTFCSGGSCQAACGAGLVNCSGTCIDPTTNNAHCGAAGTCGAVCAGGTLCTPDGHGGGSCTANCSTGLSICPAGNSCVDEQHDPSHCGATCKVCNGQNVTTNVCRSGACSYSACNMGYGSCDGNDANGCEANLTNDANNCGACGNVCATGKVCTASVCTTPSPVLLLDGEPNAPSVTLRGADNGCGGHFTVSTPHTLTKLTSPVLFTGTADFKFAVYSEASGTVIFVSPPVTVVGTGARQFIDSGTISVMLTVGVYDIAAISDSATTVQYFYGLDTETSSGITAAGNDNSNFGSYAMPSFEGNGGANCPVQLYGN